MDEEPILEVENLRTHFETDTGTVKAVDGIGFSLKGGEIYGLVGESGAGKTVTGLSLLRLIDHPGRIVDGSIRFDGRDLLSLSDSEMRDVRGNRIAMIFQDPMTALNPAYTVGTQITDVIHRHQEVDEEAARERAVSLLDDVGIPDPESRIDSYPHQFSGGMRQRALIAMALSCNPDVLIADEPTTALDVTIQAQILDLLTNLREEYNVTIQLITHNMGIITEVCDRVGVMYAGEIVEEGPVRDVVTDPQHPYTMGLMKAVPYLDDHRDRLEPIPGTMPDLIDTPSGCSFRTRCPYEVPECGEVDPPLEAIDADGTRSTACIRADELEFEFHREGTRADEQTTATTGEPLVSVRELEKYFDPESQSWLDRLFGEREYVHAVDDISLDIYEGETLGLVGESGCGKTTLGRVLSHLYEPDSGTILYAGEELSQLDKGTFRERKREMQMIFQDPFSSLNPRKTVGEIVGRPLEIHQDVTDPEENRAGVINLLEDVGLEEGHVDRYPHEFSGGQKQRIGIARALAVDPEFIVADEPVSALDVSIQAKILNLLMDLQEERDLTYVFIAHDLNVVQHIADRIAVMYLGEIVELGTVEDVFSPPHHPYTEILLSSIPSLDPDVEPERIVPEGSPPSPIDPPSGCRFHTRCPYAMEECATTTPARHEMNSDDHEITCHLFDEEHTADSDIRELIEEQYQLSADH